MDQERTKVAGRLDTYLTNKVAEAWGISPEEVTDDFIHEGKEQKYPNQIYDCPWYLSSYTRNELDELQERVDAGMEAILAE